MGGRRRGEAGGQHHTEALTRILRRKPRPLYSMSAVSRRVELRSVMARRLRDGSLVEYIVVMAALGLLLWVTSPYSFGDMMNYAGDVAIAFEVGPLSKASPLWEFGHLLWRPIGYVLTRAATYPEPVASALELSLVTARIFIALNLIAAAVAVALWYSIARKITGSFPFAATLTLGFAAGNGFLNYAHTGSSYVFGLAFVSFATWLAFRAAERKRLDLTAAGAIGVFSGFAAAVWFPFILAAPASALTAILWNEQRGLGALRERRAFTFIAAAATACSAFLAAWLLVAVLVLEINSCSQFVSWVVHSGHGWSQTINALRMATGVPRLFYDIGFDGLIWKRFTLGDPYAPVSVSRLVCCASLWKLAVSWAVVLVLPLTLWVSKQGRPAFWIFLAAAAPLAWFAVFVMEPSSPERFLPGYPHLLLSFAAACMLTGRWRLPVRVGVTCFLASILVSNVVAMWKPAVDRNYEAAAVRIDSIRERVGSKGAIFFLLTRDEAYAFTKQRPFHPLNRKTDMLVWDLIETGTSRGPLWRERLAEIVTGVWKENGEVWVSKRVLAEKPAEEWYWVEGDVPRVRWTDLPAFFSTLTSSEERGGPDGFFLVDQDQHNLQIFRELLAQ